MKTKICAAVSFMSLICVIGFAGALELEIIGFAEFIAREALALASMFISAKIGGFIE